MPSNGIKKQTRFHYIESYVTIIFFLHMNWKCATKVTEDLIYSGMLHRNECFQKFLGDDGALLNDTVALLRATSALESMCLDRRQVEDKRLDNITKALEWFNEW